MTMRPPSISVLLLLSFCLYVCRSVALSLYALLHMPVMTLKMSQVPILNPAKSIFTTVA